MDKVKHCERLRQELSTLYGGQHDVDDSDLAVDHDPSDFELSRQTDSSDTDYCERFGECSSAVVFRQVFDDSGLTCNSWVSVMDGDGKVDWYHSIPDEKLCRDLFDDSGRGLELQNLLHKNIGHERHLALPFFMPTEDASILGVFAHIAMMMLAFRGRSDVLKDCRSVPLTKT